MNCTVPIFMFKSGKVTAGCLGCVHGGGTKERVLRAISLIVPLQNRVSGSYIS